MEIGKRDEPIGSEPEERNIVIGNPRTSAPSKTLLDEFAMAAMAAIVGKLRVGISYEGDGCAKERAVAIGAYDYAKSMMKERARRDEIGNVKEAEK